MSSFHREQRQKRTRELLTNLATSKCPKLDSPLPVISSLPAAAAAAAAAAAPPVSAIPPAAAAGSSTIVSLVGGARSSSSTSGCLGSSLRNIDKAPILAKDKKPSPSSISSSVEPKLLPHQETAYETLRPFLIVTSSSCSSSNRKKAAVGNQPPKALLVSGPSGSGKATMVRVACQRMGLSPISVDRDSFLTPEELFRQCYREQSFGSSSSPARILVFQELLEWKINKVGIVTILLKLLKENARNMKLPIICLYSTWDNSLQPMEKSPLAKKIVLRAPLPAELLRLSFSGPSSSAIRQRAVEIASTGDIRQYFFFLQYPGVATAKDIAGNDFSLMNRLRSSQGLARMSIETLSRVRLLLFTNYVELMGTGKAARVLGSDIMMQQISLMSDCLADADLIPWDTEDFRQEELRMEITRAACMNFLSGPEEFPPFFSYKPAAQGLYFHPRHSHMQELLYPELLAHDDGPSTFLKCQFSGLKNFSR